MGISPFGPLISRNYKDLRQIYWDTPDRKFLRKLGFGLQSLASLSTIFQLYSGGSENLNEKITHKNQEVKYKKVIILWHWSFSTPFASGKNYNS